MKNIYPELGENLPKETQIECTIACSGKFRLTTDLQLKGRGIDQTGNGENNKRNKKTYVATEKAFEKIKQQYKCCFISFLD